MTTMKRDRIVLFAGVMAAAATLTLPLADQLPFLMILEIPFGFTNMFAIMLFGWSPHDSLPQYHVVVLASVVNALIWIGLVRAWFWCGDFLRALRS